MMNYCKHNMRGKRPAVIAGWIVLGILAIVGLGILLGFVVMWLWNWLMPELFGLPTIVYWQAVGLFILAKILIGGCGGRSGHHHEKHHSRHGKKRDFSKWEHYDRFWEDEGEKAYQDYLNRKNAETDTKNDSE